MIVYVIECYIIYFAIKSMSKYDLLDDNIVKISHFSMSLILGFTITSYQQDNRGRTDTALNRLHKNI